MGNLLRITGSIFLGLLGGIVLGYFSVKTETEGPIDIPSTFYPQFRLVQQHLLDDNNIYGNWWCYRIEKNENGPVFLFQTGHPSESVSYFFGFIERNTTTTFLPIRAYVDRSGSVVIE